MAGTVTIDTSQLRRLAADFDRGGRDVERLSRLALRKTGKDIERDAKALIRQLGAIDTGNLVNSVTTTTTLDATGLLVEVHDGVDYGVFVHDGTSRMAARPWLTPAYDRRVPQLEAALQAIAAGVI